LIKIGPINGILKIKSRLKKASRNIKITRLLTNWSNSQKNYWNMVH